MWHWEIVAAAGEIKRHRVSATLILILEEEVHVTDLRPTPPPVIGRPCWRQILLYVFQMVEADDEADEARLIYRRPRFGYGS